MGLENQIRLPRKPETRVPEMREHRLRTLVDGRISLSGSDLWRGIQLRHRERVWLLRPRGERCANSRCCQNHKPQPACAPILELPLLSHISTVETSAAWRNPLTGGRFPQAFIRVIN